MNRNEIYVNAPTRTVTLSVPVTPIAGTLNVFIYDDDVQVHEITAVTAADNNISFALPFSLAQYDRELEIKWSFSYEETGAIYDYEASTFVEIVTPILPMQTVLDILGTGHDINDATEVEQSVRHLIQAHTGQTFGKFKGTKTIIGKGTTSLNLPARLIRMKSLNNSTAWSGYANIDAHQWSITSRSFFAPPPIRADYHGINEYTYSSGVPIAVPPTAAPVFRAGMSYIIDGEWGWDFVPAAVAEAAALLIHDYACADSAYRDRFLTSMTAADWRIQFHEGAFTNTGNARANKLLEAYVIKRGWAVL